MRAFSSVHIGGEVIANEDEAGGVGGAEEELEVAGGGGEYPVRFTAVGDDHGGGPRWMSELTRRVEDGDSEERGVEAVVVAKRVWECEGDVLGGD